VAKFFHYRDAPEEAPKGHRTTILSGIKDKYVEDDYVSALKLVYNRSIRMKTCIANVGTRVPYSPI